ncbi:MAG: hypothetical protein WDO68_03910 [Gammaproteobacteria bacterium]
MQASAVTPWTLTAKHVRHGALTIDRLATTPLDANRIMFKLMLEKGGNDQPATLVRVTVKRLNPAIGHYSSLGYCALDLERQQPDRQTDGGPFGSAAALLHASFARTGVELELDTFVIEDVVSRSTERFCRRIGMHPVRVNDRWMPTKKLLCVTQAHAHSLGWNFSPL